MASAADEVVSKNVVGFNTEAFTSGHSWMQAMQYDKVGGLTNTLEDIVVDPVVWDGTQLQIPYLVGTLINMKIYTCLKEDPLEGDQPAGWYDGNNYVGDTIKIPTGSGFWLIPNITTPTNITFSGEVVYPDTQVSLVSGKSQMLCNPYPVSMKLEDIVINPVTFNNSQLQVPYLVGTLINMKIYTCLSEDPLEGDQPAGWYDGNAYVGDTVTLPIGQGFWVIPNGSGTITFTSPL